MASNALEGFSANELVPGKWLIGVDGVEVGSKVRSFVVEAGVDQLTTVVLEYNCFETFEFSSPKATVHHYCPVLDKAKVVSDVPAGVHPNQMTLDDALEMESRERDFGFDATDVTDFGEALAQRMYAELGRDVPVPPDLDA